MIVVVWGVSGCGKSTIGEMLALQLGWVFFDADDYHPAANISKMSQGIPLNDDDRWPWLDALNNLLNQQCQAGKNVVLACSALRQSYRDRLQIDDQTKFVQLSGSFELIEARLKQRQHEFMDSNLLTSQFDTLESDPKGLALDIEQSPECICQHICGRLELA